jgi:hypothetical protein
MPIDVPSGSDDGDFDEFLAQIFSETQKDSQLGLNDLDTVVTNDLEFAGITPVIAGNDFDITSNDIDLGACAVVIANVSGKFVFGPHTFVAPPATHSFTTCGFNNVVSFIGLGSFIFDINVDVSNREASTTRASAYTEINAGEVIIVKDSTTNFKFNANPGQTATLLFQISPITTVVTTTTTETVCTPVSGCLTSNDDIRRFVLDRMVDDNEIDLELFFSDEEINHARSLAVANYNEIPPYVDAIQLTDCNKDCLVAPIMFLSGIAYYMYIKKLQKLQKEDIDYQAGGMTVSIIKKRIAHIAGNIKIFKQEFLDLAMARKTHINYQSAFGRVG